MKTAISLTLFCFLAITSGLWSQESVALHGRVIDGEGRPVQGVVIRISTSYDEVVLTDDDGAFTAKVPKGERNRLSFQGIQIEPFEQEMELNSDSLIEFVATIAVKNLYEVVVESESDAFGIRQLRSLEDGGLYEGKKTEVVNIEMLIANKAANNARQTFGKIPSLNIWESDNAGLQLDIGGRGLSPRRTSNFNTRQNGYDISADALGYPESYYTPPLLAVQQVEVVRGAGALQYGSQFGGLVNFKMKKGATDKPINVETLNTVGAYGFFNTYNSVHGQVDRLNYYTYLHYKRGDGWRDNSEFEQYGAAGSFTYELSDRLSIGLDLTYMYYLSQQAGGQTDEQFNANPRASNRDRNWFRVNWNLAAFNLEYEISEHVKLYSKVFGLLASRTSLGVLETPDIEDPLSNRDLIDGDFGNIGNETRLSYKFGSGELKHSLLVGTRLYRGNTNFSQKFGTAGADANFEEVDTAFLDRRRSDYDFPNLNGALFAESVIRLSPSFSVVPGVRYEYIESKSEGYYTTAVRTNSFGDFIEREIGDESINSRHIFLYGLGVSKKLSGQYELYANATSNYRAINFTDVQIQTNTQLVDSMISDESGYSFDLGLRRRSFSPFFIEGGLFYIIYDDRIGEVIDDGLRLRTNIGAARIYGLELFVEADVFAVLGVESRHRASMFLNGSINRGEYTDVNDRALAGVRSGNKLEDIPDYNIKLGVSYALGRFATTIQTTFVGEQFSDAANTVTPFKGVFGEIPSYTVVDVSARYSFSDRVQVSASLNNLFDESYFTRRAPGYPGPGIIAAQGRLWSLTLGIEF